MGSTGTLYQEPPVIKMKHSQKLSTAFGWWVFSGSQAIPVHNHVMP